MKKHEMFIESDAPCYSCPLPKRREKQVRQLIKDCETIRSSGKGINTAEVNPVDAKPEPHLFPVFPLHTLGPAGSGKSAHLRQGIVIGVMRMGYGHYRTGLAIASAVAARGIIPYFFDPGRLSPGIYRRLASFERWYKLGSSLADSFPPFDKLFWERGTGKTFKSLSSIIQVYKAAKVLLPAFFSLPTDIPFVGTHSWLSQAASLRGIPSVVNAVQDNWSQGFFLSQPGRQCIQGPSAFMSYRLSLGMGAAGSESPPLPADSLHLTGHFVDRDILTNLDEDCKNRLLRRKTSMPKRFLFSLGGAGAQQGLLESVVITLLPYIKKGKASLVINCGDHRQAWKVIIRILSGSEITPVLHEKWEDTLSLFGYGRALKSSLENLKGIHVYLSEDIIPAVYTTNLFMRWCDFLITKPSELAFYPVPKLNLRHLGFHEAYNAYRSSEIGDGTPELADKKQIIKTLTAVMENDDLLLIMIRHILANHKADVYSGAQKLLDLFI